MVKINENYLLLQNSYLFVEVNRRSEKYMAENPDKNVIKMGIGDVTKPLVPTVINAFKDAVDEMAEADSFMGYGPEQGYYFLAEAIIKNDFNKYGIDLDLDEVFISDGAKCDTGNIQEIFALDNVIAVTDPVYPVYVDTNVMAGRSGNIKDDGMYENIVYLPCTEENNFVPELPTEHVDLIYLCFPNNPTGTTLTKDQLAKFVEYAKENDALILFDAAYEVFITEDDVPHTIYEIEGAKEVAIEFRSFSKTAGFTGIRCAYSVIPNELEAFNKTSNSKINLNRLWYRRQATKFNGVSYITQRGAEAVYSEKGQKEIKSTISYYLENAKIIKNALKEANMTVYGGEDAPYIWVKTLNNMTSWEFFDYMLNNFNIVGTPGSGFGKAGEGFFRFTSFASRENIIEASNRLKSL